MDIVNIDRAPAFITKDGSEIRELLAHRNSCIRNQTLAEARLPSGGSTTPHRHRKTEEIYYILEGDGVTCQNLYSSKPLLKQVYQSADRQIAHLIETVGSDAIVIVFSLHGMKAAFGFPFFLSQLLCAKGFSQIVNWKDQSWAEKPRHLFAAAKKRAPRQVRQLYYKLASQSTIKQFAQPTMMPVYDWQRTRAFSSPSDQYGWIRINLKGREAKGCVAPENYQETVEELESMLRELKNHEGKPLVNNVISTASNGFDSAQHRIPDLVVHWTDEAFASNLGIEGTYLEPEVLGVRTGQHALSGFCVVKGGPEQDLGSSIRAEEMGALITKWLVQH